MEKQKHHIVMEYIFVYSVPQVKSWQSGPAGVMSLQVKPLF